MVRPVDLQVSLNATIEQGPRAHQEQAAAIYRSLQDQAAARQQALQRPEQIASIPNTSASAMQWIDDRSAKRSYRYREIEAEYRSQQRDGGAPARRRGIYYPAGMRSKEELPTGEFLDRVA